VWACPAGCRCHCDCGGGDGSSLRCHNASVLPLQEVDNDDDYCDYDGNGNKNSNYFPTLLDDKKNGKTKYLVINIRRRDFKVGVLSSVKLKYETSN